MVWSKQHWCLAILLGCLVQTSLAQSPASDPDVSTSSGNVPSRHPKTEGFRGKLDMVGRFLTGKEQINRDRAIELYRQGDAEFRRAMSGSVAANQAAYGRAGDLFARAAQAYPGSALEQDAMFMGGQSYFFSNQLTKAEDLLGRLQSEHSRNRHSEQAQRLLIAIARYWIDTDKAGAGSIVPVNFVDAKRPWTDPRGHGLRVLDQLRFDDPTGKLADDATMIAGVEYMRKQDFFQADQMFTDLRELFPDSEHQFNAHMLGLECKLGMYAGANYSGLALDEAGELVKRMRQIFPQQLRDAEIQRTLAESEATIEYLQAEKLWNRAGYREKQGNYGGAKIYYEELLTKFPQTPFADPARERLNSIVDKPPVPPQRLAFLARLFPSSRPEKPILTSEGQILRR